MRSSFPVRARRARALLGVRVGLMVVGITASVLPSAAQERPTVRLMPDPIGVEETGILEIEVEGLATNVLFDASFEVENLRLLNGPHQATALEIVNSVRTTRRTLSWRVRPIEVGTSRVHNIQLSLGDRTVPHPDVTMTVQAEPPPDRFGRRGRAGGRFDPIDADPFGQVFNRNRRPRRQREAPKIFLRAEATPQRPYVGQQVVYTLYLYTQVDILSFSHQELPKFQGFWAHEIPHPDQRQPEMINHEGERFGRVVLDQRALFPRREGDYEIEPVRVQMAARVPDNSPFGALLSRTTELERVSNAINLSVQALPDAPAGFAGAIGRLSLDADLSPNDLAVGEAATLTLTLSGPGQLKGIPQPALPELPGIKVFPPQQQASDRLRGTTLIGRRVWSFVLVPERPGEWQLPAIEIPYFDPQRGNYRFASVDDLTIVARGATSLPQADGDTVSLHPIRNAALPSARSSLAVGRAAPWLFGAPFLGLGLLLLWRRRRHGAHPGARRDLLAALDQAAGVDEPRRVAAQVEDAWRAYLETRWQVPPGSASTSWQRRLTENGVETRTAEELVKLADDLHYLRYAPKLSSTDELRRELIERSRKLAKRLG